MEIKKYMKRPVEIQAMQYTGVNGDEILAFGEGKISFCYDTRQPEIKTLEGNLLVSNMDYVIKGTHGEFYPIKPDIFASNYAETAVVMEEFKKEMNRPPKLSTPELKASVEYAAQLHHATENIKQEGVKLDPRPDKSCAKSLGNTDADGAKKNVKDIVFWGNGDLFKLISKASSKNEGWMKSTKAMEIPGVGCVVQVTTQQGEQVAEALTFVPGVMIMETRSEIQDPSTVTARSLVAIPAMKTDPVSSESPTDHSLNILQKMAIYRALKLRVNLK